MSKQLKFPKVSVARLQVQQERSNAKSKLEEEKHHWVYGWWTSCAQLEQAHMYSWCGYTVCQRHR